ncbi:hypothetical protein JCM14467A_09960 [Vulcanisaeta sp. JCM 14467]
MDTAIRLFRRFVREELPKYRVNVRRDDGTYKLTTARIRQFLAKYLPENEVSGAMIALSFYLHGELHRLGFEVVYSNNRGTYIIRKRVASNAQENDQ